jgi:transposase InsO family protein
LFYGWKDKKAKGQLENKKRIAKNIWWKIGEEKVKEVLEKVEKYKEIATCYMVSVKTGVSESSVGNIFRKHGVNTKKAADKKTKKATGSCEWLKVNVCWSIDTIFVRLNGSWVYVQVVIEEYSRYILGYRINGINNSPNELIEEIKKKTGVIPFILKKDRGKEFFNTIFLKCLSMGGIISMFSPLFYAMFNGKMERTNRIIRAFLKPVEKNNNATMEDLEKTMERAVNTINNELPRKMFGGKTSAEIYRTGEKPDESERAALIEEISRKYKEVVKEAEEKKKKWDRLDIERICVVKSVTDLNLCRVKYGSENVNQLPV